MAAEPDEAPTSFTTVPGDPGSPWILHVPHASTRIPAAVRARIVLDDGQLDAELRAMTDAHTDRLAARTSERVATRRPWAFVNGLSRLVVDPERFPDEREVMNRAGMGAVYTRTSTGAPLRGATHRRPGDELSPGSARRGPAAATSSSAAPRSASRGPRARRQRRAARRAGDARRGTRRTSTR
jgi:hypothetical protein